MRITGTIFILLFLTICSAGCAKDTPTTTGVAYMESEDTTIMYCPSCGAQYSHGKKICSKDGTPLVRIKREY